MVSIPPNSSWSSVRQLLGLVPATADATPALQPTGPQSIFDRIGFDIGDPSNAMALQFLENAMPSTQQPHTFEGVSAAASNAQAMKLRQQQANQAEADRQKAQANAKLIGQAFGDAFGPEYEQIATVNPEIAAKLVDINAKKKAPADDSTPQGRATLADSYGLTGRDRLTYIMNGKLPDGATAGGPYDGTSMDAQNWNIILTGDPSSPKYAAAYSQLFQQPKITFQPTPQGMVPIQQMPVVPKGVRPPTYNGGQPTGIATAAAPAIPTSAAPSASSVPYSGSPDVAPIGTVGNMQVGKPLPGTAPKTEAQQRYGLLGTSLAAAVPEVMANWDALSDPKQQLIGYGGNLTSFMNSPEYQKGIVGLRSAISDIIPAISGAAFSTQEIKEKVDAFTPKIGDKPDTLRFKKKLFLSYVQGIANASSDPELQAKAQSFLDQISEGNGGGSGGGNVTDMGGGITIEEVP